MISLSSFRFLQRTLLFQSEPMGYNGIEMTERRARELVIYRLSALSICISFLEALLGREYKLVLEKDGND